MALLEGEGGVIFGEPTIIARAGAGGSVIGICAGPGPGSVTCTLQPHGVQIFDVPSATCKQSWALRGRRPALPAAVVGGSGRLVLACEDRQAISWSSSDADIKAAKVAKLDGDLHAVLTEPSLDAAGLLFKDGKVRLMSPDLQQELGRAALQLPKGSTFLHAEVSCSAAGGGQGDAAFLILAVSSAGKGGTATLWRVRVTGSAAGGWSVSKPRCEELSGAPGATVVACAAHPRSAVLSVVWSDGAWTRLRVAGPNTATKSVTLGAADVGGARLGDAGTVGAGTAAAVLGTDYVVLVGRQTGGAAAGPSGARNALVAMDAEYGSEQGRVELQWDAHDDGSQECAAHAVRQAAAARDGSFVAVALDRSVAAVAASAAPMTLSLAIATAAHRRAGAGADPAAPAALRPVDVAACLAQVGAALPGGGADSAGCEEPVADLVAGVDAVARAVKEGSRRELRVLAQLEKLDAEGSAGGSVGIVRAVRELIDELHAEAEADVRRLQPLAGAKGAGKGAAGAGAGGRDGRGDGRGRRRPAAVVSPHLCSWVCARCVSDARKGQLDAAALALVQAGCVSARAQEALLPYAIKRSDLVLLEAMLKHVRDIPEDGLVGALRLVLAECSKASMDAFVAHWAAASPPQTVPDHDAVRRHLLDLVLVSPKDHFLLARALARLSLRQALRLLRYCHSLLKMHGVAPVVRLHKLRGARAPSLACVVEWTNALIDAHFSSLVLAKECHPLLRELKELTRAETDLARETVRPRYLSICLSVYLSICLSVYLSLPPPHISLCVSAARPRGGVKVAGAAGRQVSMDGLLQHLVQRKPLPVDPVRPYSVDTLYL